MAPDLARRASLQGRIEEEVKTKWIAKQVETFNLLTSDTQGQRHPDLQDESVFQEEEKTERSLQCRFRDLEALNVSYKRRSRAVVSYKMKSRSDERRRQRHPPRSTSISLHERVCTGLE